MFIIKNMINEISRTRGFGEPIEVSVDSSEKVFTQVNWEGVPDIENIKPISNNIKIIRFQ